MLFKNKLDTRKKRRQNAAAERRLLKKQPTTDNWQSTTITRNFFTKYSCLYCKLISSQTHHTQIESTFQPLQSKRKSG